MHISLLVLFITPYLVVIISFIAGWFRTRELASKTVGDEPFVSVLIPVKNEAGQIKDLINDLENQNYQKTRLEVILINDHSEDETCQIAEAEIANNKIFRIISLPAGISGKKKALKTGIAASKGNLILTTDADCRFTKNWVKTMVRYFHNYPGHLLVGPVFIKEGKGFFNHFQSLEFLSLIASGAGAIGIGHPIMCNGANLGGSRSLFQKAGSIYNSSIASGDDIFLLLELKKHNSPAVFVKDNDAVVITNNQKSFGNYLSQRGRWTFKSRFYKDFDIISVAVIVLLTNLFLVFGLFYLPFSISFADDYLLIYSVKSFADYILLYYVAQFFKRKYLLKFFLLHQLLYMFYSSFVGIWGHLKKTTWKTNTLYKS